MGDDLDKRIAAAQAKIEANKPTSGLSSGKGMGLGMRMASDFVAAVLVGLVLGWGIGELFGWQPWALIVCLILGFITGVRNVVRQANAMQSAATETDTGAEPTSEGKDPGA
jgi:ATP synthase protein I